MSEEIKRETIFSKGALMGNFGAKVDAAKKTVVLHFEGYFNDSCAEKFFNEYNKAKSSVDLSKTSLYVNAKGLKPFPQESLDSAGSIYKDYLSFKDVTFLEPDNTVASSQIHRVLRNNGIEDKFKFVKE